MRATPLSAAVLCILLGAAATPALSQGGGKKHHKTDSTPPPAADQTIKTSTTVASPFHFSSDVTFKGTATVGSGETPATEVAPVHQIKPNGENVAGVYWDLNNGGRMVLTLSPDGHWTLEGNYPTGGPINTWFDLAMAIKFKSGEVYIFHYVGTAPHGWTMGEGGGAVGSSKLSEGFEIRAAYRLPTEAEAKAEGNKMHNRKCETTAQFAAGWGPIWQWTDPHKKCVQFNIAHI